MKTYSDYLLTIPFFISGLLSSIIFHSDFQNGDKYLINGLWAGGLFTIATILTVLITGHNLKFPSTVFFLTTMYLSYLALFFLTAYSTFAGFFVGIITGGIGALTVFYLINRFIVPIQYKKKTIFLWGTTAFLIVDILVCYPFNELIEPIYVIRGWVGTVFAPTFLFWQTIVGYRIVKTISVSNT